MYFTLPIVNTTTRAFHGCVAYIIDKNVAYFWKFDRPK
jgi:hypothetical protein